jgi:hypothetical protein
MTGQTARAIMAQEAGRGLQPVDTALIFALIGAALATGWSLPRGETAAFLALAGGAAGGAVAGRLIHRPLTALSGSALARLPARWAGLLGAALLALGGLPFSWSAFLGGAAAGALLGALLVEFARCPPVERPGRVEPDRP